MQLDDVSAVLRAGRLQLQVQQDLDRSDLERAVRGRQRRREEGLFLRGEVVDDDAVRLNGDARLHGDEPSAMVLEGFVTHEEVDILRGARMSVRADREAADDPVPYTQPSSTPRPPFASPGARARPPRHPATGDPAHRHAESCDLRGLSSGDGPAPGSERLRGAQPSRPRRRRCANSRAPPACSPPPRPAAQSPPSAPPPRCPARRAPPGIRPCPPTPRRGCRCPRPSTPSTSSRPSTTATPPAAPRLTRTRPAARPPRSTSPPAGPGRRIAAPQSARPTSSVRRRGQPPSDGGGASGPSPCPLPVTRGEGTTGRASPSPRRSASAPRRAPSCSRAPARPASRR